MDGCPLPERDLADSILDFDLHWSQLGPEPTMKCRISGGDYVAFTLPGATGVASTIEGRQYLCAGDQCRPIPERTFRRALQELVHAGHIRATGEKRWRTYRLPESIGHAGNDGR